MNEHNTNARKHGLATCISADADTAQQIHGLATALTAEEATLPLRHAAERAARSFFELRRIASARTALIEHYCTICERKLKLQLCGAEPTQDIRFASYAFAYSEAHSQLQKIYRYERRAQSQFRRAMREYRYAQERERKSNPMVARQAFGAGQ